MKKILFPIDFSETSFNAFRYALHFAKKINAEIVTLHVYEFPAIVYSEYGNFLIDNYNVNVWTEFENYKDEVPKLRAIAENEQLEHIKISHVLKQGNVQDSILDLVKKEHADYIVMGTKGATGLKEIFLGTVTQSIMNNAKVPVFAVPSDCEYQPIKRILFLTKYEKAHLPILKIIFKLAKVFEAHLDVLQVSSSFDNTHKTIYSEWEKSFPKSEISFFTLTSNDYEGTINEFMKLHKTNLVTMPIHHLGFFEKIFSYSLSRKLTFHSNIPILGLYERKETETKHVSKNQKTMHS